MDNEDTIPSLFLATSKRHKESPGYYTRNKAKRSWDSVTWEVYAKSTKRVARSLVSLGLEAEGKVCILGDVTPEWVEFFLGAMMVGGIPVGIYSTFDNSGVEYVLEHSEAVAVLVKDAAQFAKVSAVKEKLPLLKHIIAMKEAEIADPSVLSWESFLEKGDDTEESVVLEKCEALQGNQTATICYTPGTTGKPKAVMLSHKSITDTALKLAASLDLELGDSCIAYLQTSEIMEQHFTIYCASQVGYSVYFSQGFDSFSQAVNESNLRRTIGLNELKVAIACGSSISKKVLDLMTNCGVHVMEFYGQTEACGPITLSVPQHNKIGMVGQPFEGCALKVEGGELLVKSDNLFQGYYKDDKATAQVMKDGWLHTGDLGFIDDDSYLQIFGRVADLFIQSEKTISPVLVEDDVRVFPLVGECFVIGENRPFMTAIVSLDMDIIKKVAKEQKVTPEDVITAPPTKDVIQSFLDKINPNLAKQEHTEVVMKFFIAETPFSETGGELTPTMKIKRDAILAKYSTQIDAMYA